VRKQQEKREKEKMKKRMKNHEILFYYPKRSFKRFVKSENQNHRKIRDKTDENEKRLIKKSAVNWRNSKITEI
jgi:ribosomal protein L15